MRVFCATPALEVLTAITAGELARSALGKRPSLVDAQFPAVKVPAVPELNCLLGVGILHLDETETSGAAAHLVGEYGRGDDGSGLGKRVAQAVARRRVRQIA